ncbi:MAG: hypothetical protein JWQ12_1064 [Glaciihabitans sp.]|jgi:type II secretory pathway pseudopilin PulG|nr:hypothetical protein [Glaciihabitans sp.]
MRALAASVRRRRDRAFGGSERGISLVELLVAMLLLSIVLVLIGSMYATMQKTVGFAGAANNNLKRASLGMTEMSRVVRFAATNPVMGQPISDPAFVVAKIEQLTIYSYVDANASAPQPIKITFSLDGSRRLVESRFAAYSVSNGYWGFNSAAYSTRVLTGTVLAPATGELPLFSYQTADGTLLTVPAAGLSSTQTPTVAAVTITMKIKGETGTSNPLILANTVGLPNLGLNRTGQ